MKKILLLLSLCLSGVALAQTPPNSPVIWNGSCASGVYNLASHSCLVTGGSSSVTSVNTRTGAVVLSPTDVSDSVNTSTGYFDIPSGTTAQRPASPDSGMLRHNTDTGRNEFYTGSVWVNHARLIGDTFTGTVTAPTIVANTSIGIGTASPTSPLTFASSPAGGATWYNTADQTTNFEKMTLAFSGNTFGIRDRKSTRLNSSH